MNIQFEEINTPPDSSFRLLVNPRLNDFYLWHFHPEFELVYIEGSGNTRHVGHHSGDWQKHDLIFVGSNIPHLNFDYGIKDDYEKYVIQIRSDFMDQSISSSPEMMGVVQLFQESTCGVIFSEPIKYLLSQRIKKLHTLPTFQQFIEVLEIFHILAQDDNRILLHDRPFKNQYSEKEQEKLKAVYKYIDENYHRKISIAEVALICGLTREAFCRYFKKMTKLTFTQFLNHYRVNIAKRLFLQGKNVTETCFDCGFESLSYFNRVFKKVTGENPMSFISRTR